MEYKNLLDILIYGSDLHAYICTYYFFYFFFITVLVGTLIQIEIVSSLTASFPNRKYCKSDLPPIDRIHT